MSKHLNDDLSYKAVKDRMKKFRETRLDIEELKGNNKGTVEFVGWTTTNSFFITLEEAQELVKSKKAQVFSPDTIYNIRKYRAKSKKRNNFLKKLVIKNAKGKCYYCGKKGDTIDHIIPLSKGGLDILENIVCSCVHCNYKKDDSIEFTPKSTHKHDPEEKVETVTWVETDEYRNMRKKPKNLDEMLAQLNSKNKWE